MTSREAALRDQVAWSWVEHVRAGGTTPWATFARAASGSPDPGLAAPAPTASAPTASMSPASVPPTSVASVPTGRALPGAAQLEVVRRIAQRGRAGDGFAHLADTVLARSGPGRGPGQQPLLWPGDAPAGTVGATPGGTPPVDPAEVPATELIRVCAGTLAQLLLELASPPVVEERAKRASRNQQAGPPPLVEERAKRASRNKLASPPVVEERAKRASRNHPGRRLERPWRSPVHLAGAPVTRAALAAELTAAGRAPGGRRLPGGRRPVVVLVATPFDVLMGEVWEARARLGSPVRWSGFLATWAARDRLPASADLAGLAEHWAARVGPSRVHVVVDDGRALRRTAGELLGVRLHEPEPELAPEPELEPEPGAGAAGRDTEGARRLTPEAVDLLCRVNAVLAVRAPEPLHRALARRLVAHLPTGEGSPLRIPEAYRDWADGAARRTVERLRAGGYAVHGDLDAIASRHSEARRERPRRRAELGIALDACASLAGEVAGAHRKGSES